MVSICIIEPEYEINLGYIARVMKNFGIKELLLVNPRCDIERAKMYATHGKDILDQAKVVDIDHLKRFDQLIGTTAIDARSNKNIVRNSIEPSQARIIDNSCIILGRESKGLSNEELAMCDLVITIDTGSDYNIMNISHALAIILYEFTKKEKVKEHASKEEVELLINYALAVADKAGIRKDKQKNVEYALRRILGRALPTSKEVRILVTLLRKTLLAMDR